MDILEVHVEDIDIRTVDLDLRPKWVDGGMPCPVTACGTRVFTTYYGMLRHWAEIHARTVEKLFCPRCRFLHVRRNQVVRHLHRQHQVGGSEAERLLQLGHMRGPNTRYVSPGEVNIPTRPMRIPAGWEDVESSPGECMARFQDILN